MGGIEDQGSLFPEHEFDYVDVAVDRVKLAWELHHHMNPDGKPMHMAFSGGKDSICLFFICKKASEQLGIPMEEMFHVQYNVTNVDPPELVYFIRELKKDYPFIELHHPKKTMWKLIEEKKMPPTRIVRYCCSALKESSNIRGGYSLTGVRRAESSKRADRQAYEAVGAKSAKFGTDRILLNDNDDRRETEYCMQENTYVCNPIIDWSDDDVWGYIHHENLPYCKLYDEGWTRLGCIGCPIGNIKNRRRELDRWPNFAECYKRAFQKMLDANKENARPDWHNGNDVYDWWVNGENGGMYGKEHSLFDEEE